jgi:hypothetical protein
MIDLAALKLEFEEWITDPKERLEICRRLVMVYDVFSTAEPDGDVPVPYLIKTVTSDHNPSEVAKAYLELAKSYE